MSKIKRVACAISGGVDSAVTALLLKRRGYEVVGVHMINWDPQDESDDNLTCTRTKDLADAKWLCKYLNIELHIANFVKEYWNVVFTRMLENYKNGRTIVPDIDCNRQIKFKLLWKYIKENIGADAIATGHFARSSEGDYLENSSQLQVKLLRAKDPIKDQTFFLSSLSNKQLKNVMFPLGSICKNDVKKIAADAGMDQFANKVESMGICFIGKKNNFESFLTKYIDPISGRFVDIENEKEIPNIRHNGVHNFTIGKRIHLHGKRGGNNSLQSHISGNEALYVCNIDASTQTIYLCRSSAHPKLYAKRLLVCRPKWISNESEYVQRIIDTNRSFKNSLSISIQRSHLPYLAKIHISKGKTIDSSEYFEVEPYLPLRAAAPGQICVFYNGDECLGCAEIDSVLQTL